MNTIKHKIMTNMTNDQKTMLLLKIPYINNFKLLSIYENKIKFIDNNLLLTFKGGNTNNYDKEYNNDTGKYNIIINNNQYYYNVEQYSFYDEKCIEDKQFKFINLITTKL